MNEILYKGILTVMEKQTVIAEGISNIFKNCLTPERCIRQ